MANVPAVAGAVIAPAGLLVLWGGISGNLAAILAALFAPSLLVPVSGTSLLLPPGLIPPGESPPKEENAEQPALEPGESIPAGTGGIPAELPPADTSPSPTGIDPVLPDVPPVA